MLSRATEDADDEQQKSSRHDEDWGYMALARRVVEQAKADRTHTCHRTHGCGAVCDIRETARQFLLDIRSGAAGLWSQWVDLASLSIGNERWLTDNQPESQPEPLPLFTPPPSPPPPVVPKYSQRERIAAYAKKNNLLTAREAAALTGFHYTVFMLHGRVHPAEKYLSAYLYRRRDLDRYMTTPAYQDSVKRQAAMLARRVTAEMIVQSGFELDPQGVAEFMRLLRQTESETIPDAAAV